jgi:outer membrane receptor protein involved in Fe transport
MKNLGIFIIIIFLSAGSVLVAQTGGKIVGQVSDAETGELVPGCNILIEGTLLGAATDEEGYFYVLNIPPGTYDVSAVMVGYVKDVLQNVKVVSNLTLELEFELKSEILSGETITVEAFRTPLVQKDLTYKIQAVTSEEIARIPMTTINDILVQQAGITRQILTSPVNSLPVFGQFASIPSDGLHFRGGRDNETLILLDGIKVNDGLWGGYNIEQLGEFSLSSLEFLSGTFGPQYGDAMSGVISISSYDQIDFKPKIKFKAFSDQHGIDEESHNSYSYEAFLSSSLPFANNIGIIAAHRSYSTDGYINGYIYPEYVNSEGTDRSGTPKEVPMQYLDTQFSFGKLLWQASSRLKATIGGYYARSNEGRYNHYFKYNPYGTPRVRLEDNLLYGKLNYSLSERSLITLSLANYKRSFNSRVFDNAEDYTVIPQTGSGEFSISGEDWVYFDTYFRRLEANADFFIQVDKIHSIAAGATYEKLKTTYARKNPDGFGILEDYTYEPFEIHGYLGDKMEFEDMGMVVNIGARIDYLDTQRKVLLDIRDISNLEAQLEEGEQEIHVTPRLGLSFPIAEKAAVRFGYGHYYQYPNFYKIYQGTFYLDAIQEYRPNPQIENAPISDTAVKPEKTVNYEVGIQSILTDDIGFDVTGFYRKTSNLTGVIVKQTDIGRALEILGNIDYATVKGIELSLKKRFFNNFAATLNYTFSKTLVSTSVLFRRATDEARTFPADWDQPHVIQGTLYFEFPSGFGFSLYGSAQSGFPYTPSARSQFDHNSERAPWQSYLDLIVFKNFNYFGYTQQLFVQILNVIDRRNVWWVWQDSGIAGDDASPATSHDYTNNPAMYGPGRVIQFGIKIWN